MNVRIGFDVGGTFTDFVMVDVETGTADVYKYRTTDDPSVGALEGLRTFVDETDTDWSEVEQLIHGTTLATNTVLERDGADTALLVTDGFGDLCVLGRQKRYDLYDLKMEKQDPIVPREDVFEVGERIHPRLGVVERPDDTAVRELAGELAGDYDAVAVSFLHSYLDGSHERLVGDLIADVAPELAVSRSSDLSGQYREYERTNTAAVDAYVKPRMQRYLGELESALAADGYANPFFVMKSSGGIETPEMIRERPVHVMESGPVAGALHSANLADTLGRRDVFSFDMGGTTAKICFIVDGEPRRTDVFEVDELEAKSGSGIPINLSVVDMIEIGAGGGSVAAVEETGTISVGPESAGADPGPICYGFGGTRPTVTDADLTLGYLDPEYFLGGEMTLDEESAREGIERHVAEPLGTDVETAAWGIKRVVDSSMTQASRIHASERGIDLRGFDQVAFGGAGPMHAASVARELNVPRVVVPSGAGVASAVGLLVADVEFHLERTDPLSFQPDALDAINEIYDDLEENGLELAERAVETGADVVVERTADVKYEGQAHDISVDVPTGTIEEDDLAAVRRRFHAVYADTYGYSDPDDPIEGVTWKVTVRSDTDTPEVHLSGSSAGDRDPYKGSREAYFEDGFVECDVYERRHIDVGAELSGPAVIEDRHSTTVVPPGDAARVDEHENLVVSVGGGRT